MQVFSSYIDVAPLRLSGMRVDEARARSSYMLHSPSSSGDIKDGTGPAKASLSLFGYTHPVAENPCSLGE